MIEIQIEDAGNINIHRMWGKSTLSIEIEKRDAELLVRQLLFKEKAYQELYLAEIQELHKITGEILAENAEELETA
jgi:hypothetical protein